VIRPKAKTATAERVQVRAGQPRREAEVTQRTRPAASVKEGHALAQTPPSTTALDPTSAPAINSGVALATLTSFALGLLLLCAAAVPPARVPWPAVAEALFLRRSDLILVGIGVLGLGVLVAALA
jgi:hypothetical protein